MAKSVVQFLRGIDLTGVNFQPDGGHLPMTCGTQESLFNPFAGWSDELVRLQWLKLRDTNLTHLPADLSGLEKLEHLTLSKNQLCHVEPELAKLKRLRVLNLRKNNIVDKSVPQELFQNPELQVLDLSYNKLTEVPHGLDNASGLLVLNLSSNQISTIPNDVFIKCTDLLYLDLSNNQLESLPAQLRRLTSLQTLYLNGNPLRQSQLRSLSTLRQLTCLHLADTQRRLDTFPTDLDKLTQLVDLDLSDNALPRIPQSIFQLKTLRKLNLSGNELDDLSGLVDCWPALEYLNLSHNRLQSLPSALCRLSALRKVYVNHNQLTFNSIPSGIGKLQDLEVFNAADNKLENIPEGLCRCGRLKRLILNCNNLLTLPDAIHYLIESLEVFEYDGNPDLKFPPKPPELQQGSGLAYYNIDFSLDTQIRLARGRPVEAAETRSKDPASRIKRLRGRKGGSGSEQGEGSSRVLEGMKRVAKEKESMMKGVEEEAKQVASRRWQDALTKPNLDYSKIFDEDVGTVPGLTIWEIDEFYPKHLEEEALLGTFYEGDCYIVLHTQMDPGSHDTMAWDIYFWIGSQASLDKKACSAMHAVNLRNFLGSESRCEREEQGDEGAKFLQVMDSVGGINVVEGCRGETGFLRAEEKIPRPRLYRLYGDKQVHIISMAVCPESLDPKYVYLLDANTKLYLWLGTQSRIMFQSKGRLVADKINLKERKGKSEIIIQLEGRESPEFLTLLCEAGAAERRQVELMEQGGDGEEDYSGSEASSRRQSTTELSPDRDVEGLTQYRALDHIPTSWQPPHPIVYDVKLGKGYLEMPQIELGHMNKLDRKVLDPKKVLIFDVAGEVFMWIGEKSARFLRSAGWRLAHELVQLLPRERKSLPIPCTQGTEPHIFKAQFEGWDDAMAVDFTRTAESVSRRGANLMDILKKDQMKVDLRALFLPREKPTPWDEGVQIMDEWNMELVCGEADESEDGEGDLPKPKMRLKQFVMKGKKGVPVETKYRGHFFTKDSYVVIAVYWDDRDDEEDEEDDPDEKRPEPTRAVVYFWQGREASSMDYLTFNFSLRKGMEDRLARITNEDGEEVTRPVEMKHMLQQKEDQLFLAHFESRMVVHLGAYKDKDSPERASRVEMFQLRSNGSAICTRCTEIKPTSLHLNSCFCYLVKVPASLLGSPDAPGRVYLWRGEKAEQAQVDILEDVAKEIFDEKDFDHQTIYEGEEDLVFWAVLGGQRKMEKSADYMLHSRLFRLSNEQGYFSVSEKCSDFCQDDLADEDVMLLDTGEQVYLWIGKRTSDVEVKLSLQAAKLYKEHMQRVQPGRPRQLKLTTKAAEPYPFRRCFHGWGPFKEPKDWSG